MDKETTEKILQLEKFKKDLDFLLELAKISTEIKIGNIDLKDAPVLENLIKEIIINGLQEGVNFAKEEINKELDKINLKK